MISTHKSSVIWGYLRNAVDISSYDIPCAIKITGTTVGVFPVDSYSPILLEIPRNGSKLDISGRNSTVVSTGTRDVDWRPFRVVSLPLYEETVDSCFENIDLMIRYWIQANIPGEIPCLAFAIKTKGSYCDEREGQFIQVLLVWPDHTARILELDWFEGPVEDCITPEWYIRSSNKLPVNKSLDLFEKTTNSPPSLTRPLFSLLVNPSCMGRSFQGNKLETGSKGWKHEYEYNDHEMMITDLKMVIAKIRTLFS